MLSNFGGTYLGHDIHSKRKKGCRIRVKDSLLRIKVLCHFSGIAKLPPTMIHVLIFIPIMLKDCQFIIAKNEEIHCSRSFHLTETKLPTIFLTLSIDLELNDLAKSYTTK